MMLGVRGLHDLQTSEGLIHCTPRWKKRSLWWL